jgi:hypothetical protein
VSPSHPQEHPDIWQAQSLLAEVNESILKRRLEWLAGAVGMAAVAVMILADAGLGLLRAYQRRK